MLKLSPIVASATTIRAISLVVVWCATLAANGNEPKLYRVGDVVRARCDGGDELKRLSVYGSPKAAADTYDSSLAMPQPYSRHRTADGF
jgi:hypothetical protein